MHLARRFAGSLRPGGPSEADEAWVGGLLSEAETDLWRRMSGADRRHGVAVARRVQAALGPTATRTVLVAALLHDVGKVVARLGTFGRVAASLAGMVGRPGLTPRVEAYLRHGPVGADLLQEAGSDPLVVAWAGEHHQPSEIWSVPATIAPALKQADDD